MGDIQNPNGYHWADCPNNPKNIKIYGNTIKNPKLYDEQISKND